MLSQAGFLQTLGVSHRATVRSEGSKTRAVRAVDGVSLVDCARRETTRLLGREKSERTVDAGPACIAGILGATRAFWHRHVEGAYRVMSGGDKATTSDPIFVFTASVRIARSAQCAIGDIDCRRPARPRLVVGRGTSGLSRAPEITTVGLEYRIMRRALLCTVFRSGAAQARRISPRALWRGHPT